MLQPKKTKFRRQQKGRMKGEAQRGNFVVRRDYDMANQNA